jgi:hypothetical protein
MDSFLSRKADKDNSATHRTLESENWDRMTDNVLNSALSGRLSFLQYHSGPTLAKALLERLHTHLQTELVYIRTGKPTDGLGEYTSAKTFREKFVAMGGYLCEFSLCC